MKFEPLERYYHVSFECNTGVAIRTGPMEDCTQDIINLRDRLQRAEKNADDLEKQLHKVRARRSDMHGHHEVDAKVDERPSEKELMEAMYYTKADAENWDRYQSKKIIAALKRCGLVKP